MLDINYIRKNSQELKQVIKDRQQKFDVDSLVKLDKKKRDLLQEVEELRAEQNKASGAIAKSEGKAKKELVAEMQAVSKRLKDSEPELKAMEDKITRLMSELPNIPQSSVPVGKDDSENKELKKSGKPTEFDFKPLDHVALGEKLDIIDIKRAAKVSGSRFGYFKGAAALLEFALQRYAFDLLLKEEFIPVVPPVIVKEKAMQGLGYLSGGGEEDTYHFAKDKQYFVGTSEQSVIPMHMDEVLEETDLPLRYAAFSTCFRREAGSYGKDTKGILRVHQFDKVEMISFAQPEQSDKEHKYLLSLQEKLVTGLQLPYRVIQVCTGDLSYQSTNTYDLECWLPSQNQYRETHSTSNCTDYQARRLNIKYKNQEKKNEFVHTLNATAFAMGRMIIAILENNQQADGSVKVPEVLQAYMDGVKVIK